MCFQNVFWTVFPLVSLQNPIFSRASRDRVFLFSQKFSNCWRFFFIFAQISPNFEEGVFTEGGVLNVNPPVAITFQISKSDG